MKNPKKKRKTRKKTGPKIEGGMPGTTGPFGGGLPFREGQLQPSLLAKSTKSAVHAGGRFRKKSSEPKPKRFRTGGMVFTKGGEPRPSRARDWGEESN